MSMDIATLGLQVRSDGVVIADKRLMAMTRSAGIAEKKTVAGFARMGVAAKKLKASIFSVQTAMLSLGVGIVFYKSIKAMTVFDSGLIAIQKTTGAAQKQLAELSEEIQKMSLVIPVTIAHLLELTAVGGQLGQKTTEDLMAFTRTLGMLEVAGDIVGPEMATNLARLVGITGGAIKDIGVLGAVITKLGNEMKTTEAPIVSMATEVGRGVGIFRVSAEEVAALSASMVELGIQAESGGTTVTRSFIAINKAIAGGGAQMDLLMKMTKMTEAQLKQTWSTKSMDVFQAWIQGLADLGSEGTAAADALEQFGLKGVRIDKTLPIMAKRIDVMTKAFMLMNEQLTKPTALFEETINASKSFSAQMTLTGNAIDQIFASVGAALAPTILEIALSMRDWVKENQEFIKQDLPTEVGKLAKGLQSVFDVMADFATSPAAKFMAEYWELVIGAALGWKVAGLGGALVGVTAGSALSIYSDITAEMSKNELLALKGLSDLEIEIVLATKKYEQLFNARQKAMIPGVGTGDTRQSTVDAAYDKLQALKDKLKEAQNESTEATTGLETIETVIDLTKAKATVDAIDEITETEKALTMALQAQIDMIGETEAEQFALDILTKNKMKTDGDAADRIRALVNEYFNLKKVQAESNKMQQDAAQILNDILTPLEKYKQKLEELHDLSMKGFLTPIQELKASNKTNADFVKSQEDTVDEIKDVYSELKESMEDAFDFNFADSALSQITNLIEGVENLTGAWVDYSKDMQKIEDEKDNLSSVETIELQQQAGEKYFQSQLSGYSNLFGTIGSFYDEDSKQRKAMHTLEMVFGAASIAMEMQKMIPLAVNAVLTQGQGDFITAWPRIAAMTALVGGLVAIAGGSFGGGSGGASLDRTITGTVLGSDESSKSVDNTIELLETFRDANVAELENIYKEMQDLNNNITGLVNSIVRNFGDFSGRSTDESTASRIGGAVWGAVGDFFDEHVPLIGEFVGKIFNTMADTMSWTYQSMVGGRSRVTEEGIGIPQTSISDVFANQGIDAQSYYKIKRHGGAFGHTHRSGPRYDELDEGTADLFDKLYINISNSLVTLAEDLGMNVQDVLDYSFGEVHLNLKGLSAEEIQTKISAWVSTTMDTATNELFGELIRKYQKVDEGLMETVYRLIITKEVLLSVFKDTAQSFGIMTITFSKGIFDFVQAVSDSFGGLEEAYDAISNYADKFLTDVEKQRNVTRNMGDMFGMDSITDLNLALPETREGFKKLVKGLDITTKSGLAAYTILINAADMADSYYSTIEDGTENLKKIIEIEKDMADDLSQFAQRGEVGFLSGLDRALREVKEQGESYKDSLIGQGMEMDLAIDKTNEWTAAMSAFVQKARISAILTETNDAIFDMTATSREKEDKRFELALEKIDDERNSRIYDNDAYLTANPDVAKAIAKGRQPFFDNDIYLEMNPDVAKAIAKVGYGGTGQEHYEQWGRDEGQPFFDNDIYLEMNPDVAKAIANGSYTGTGQEHYEQWGRDEGRPIIDMYDKTEQAEMKLHNLVMENIKEQENAILNSGIASLDDSARALAEITGEFTALDSAVESVIKGFDDIIASAIDAGAALAGVFNEDEYLTMYPDVAKAVADGIIGSGAEHYAKWGEDEGRMPSIASMTEARKQAAIYETLTRPFKDIVLFSGMTDYEKAVYQINEAYKDNQKTLEANNIAIYENGILTADGTTFMAAWNAELDAVAGSVLNLTSGIASLDDLLWSLSGGSLSAVRSIEGMQQHYDELFTAAKDSGDPSKLVSFITGEFSDFYKSLGLWESVKDTVAEDITDLKTDFEARNEYTEIESNTTALTTLTTEMTKLADIMSGGNDTIFNPATPQGLSGTDETPLSYSHSDDYPTMIDSEAIGAAIAEAVAGAISQGSSGEITINLVLDGQVIDSRVIDLLTHDPEAQAQMEAANG